MYLILSLLPLSVYFFVLPSLLLYTIKFIQLFFYTRNYQSRHLFKHTHVHTRCTHLFTHVYSHAHNNMFWSRMYTSNYETSMEFFRNNQRVLCTTLSVRHLIDRNSIGVIWAKILCFVLFYQVYMYICPFIQNKMPIELFSTEHFKNVGNYYKLPLGP